MKGKIILALLLATGMSFLNPAGLDAQRRGQALQDLRGLSDDFEALSERVSQSIVQIMASGYQPLQQGDAPGTGLLTRRRVGGSGVVLDANGYIVTNLHVIEGAGRIRVRLPVPATDAAPGQSVLKPEGMVLGAQIVGVDREVHDRPS